MENQRVQAYFFGESKSPLFGLYRPPDSGYGDEKGILLCYPVGHEYMRTHWVFRRLARLLSEAGCHVFRFDYFGMGDSAGDSRDGNVDRWKADICSAFQELRDISGAKKISMVGVRFGATLATLASMDGLGIRDLVLWDPVVIGKNYVEELRALNDNLGELFARTKENEKFEELMGYPFPPSLREGIEQINLLSIPHNGAERTVLITSEDKKEYVQLRNQFEAKGAHIEHHAVSEAGEWGEPENFDQALLVNETLHKIRAVVVGEPK